MENLFKQKYPLQDLLSSLNAVISTNKSTRIITGHVIYNPAYTYKFQLKTTIVTIFHEKTSLTARRSRIIVAERKSSIVRRNLDPNFHFSMASEIDVDDKKV